MRVLIIGSAHPWRMEAAIDRALQRAGHTTLILDDRKIKRAVGRVITQQWVSIRARRFKPDFIILSKCLALDLTTVEQIIRDTPNSMWYHDPQWFRDTGRPDIGHIAAIGRLAHTCFVTGFDAEWRALGLRAKFLPAAGDAGIIPVAKDSRFLTQAAFIGTGYDPARTAVLLEVAKHHEIRVYGLGWEPWKVPLRWSGKPVEGADFAKACSSADIMLGVNPMRADGGTTYTSDRTWMVMLAGAFYLGQGTPGVMSFLHHGEHCAWYSDAENCVEQISYYLKHPEERERIRAAGEHFVRQHHTYDQRITNLLTDTEWVNPL